jgi:putative ABC transport system permease protein
MAVVAMLSIGEGAKRETLSQIELLGIKNIYVRAISLTEDQEVRARERLSRGLSYYDLDRIRKGTASVQEVACLKELSVSILGMIRETSPQVVESSANYARVQRISIARGRFLTDQDVRLKSRVCVLGNTVAKGFGPDGKPGGYVRIENEPFKVVGILRKYDKKTAKSSVISNRNYNDMIFIPTGTGIPLKSTPQKMSDGGAGQLSEIIIQVKNTDQVIGSAGIVRRILETSHGGVEDYQMVVPQALLRQSQKTQRIFNIVLGAIASISLLVGGIGIMNIMLATVSERTREIGIRRAVGATQRDIIVQFLTETVMLTLAGGVIGIVAGIGAVWIITALAGWSTAVTTYAIALPLFTSILVGLFFGIYPAYHAARMDPIVALQHNW